MQLFQFGRKLEIVLQGSCTSEDRSNFMLMYAGEAVCNSLRCERGLFFKYQLETFGALYTKLLRHFGLIQGNWRLEHLVRTSANSNPVVKEQGQSSHYQLINMGLKTLPRLPCLISW